MSTAAAGPSPDKPRPENALLRAVADTLARVEANYAREGSGPGSRFEGELLEDVMARAVAPLFAEDFRSKLARLAEGMDYRAGLSAIHSETEDYGRGLRSAAGTVRALRERL